VLQCVAVCCSMLKHVGLCCSVFVLFVRDLIRTLQHTATCSNTLQHTATHSRKSSHKESKHISTNYNTLQHTATHCITIQYARARVFNTLEHTAILQRAATQRNTLQCARKSPHTESTLCMDTCIYTATHDNTPHHTATHSNTPQYTATLCTTSQCTATRWNAVHHAATYIYNACLRIIETFANK